jgi:predicted Ser/Thr protein kinase
MIYEHAKENSDKKIIFKESDLFQNLKDKYQLIIFNPPYLPADKKEDAESALITTGGKHGYEVIEKFLEDANNYLEENGQILLVFSSHTNKDVVDEIITKNLFNSKLVESKMLPMFEQLYLYSIEKTKLLKQLKDIKDLKYFSKGHRGYIYTGKLKNKKVTVKLKNPKSKACGRIKNEINYLKILNKHGIGPKLLKSTNDYFVYEFIEKVIKSLLEKLYKMDQLGINKEEMHHPNKHILVNKTSAVMIDFEKANKSKKPHNVTQFCQYLSSLKPQLKKKGVFVNITKLRDLSRKYKKGYDKKVFKEIVDSIL